MIGKVFKIFNILIYVYVVAFEDLVYGQGSQEMMENGRSQYQLLRERANLPQYGNCWKAAINEVDEGCRMLSEETQSDMALHLTNCFLEMSGLETVNCYTDKKPNVRAICIRSMSDRAFNVYTAFYTHTQNMCWFLRSQVWHETITDNTRRVGKQLETSAMKQNEIIEAQQESLLMQEKLMHYGLSLEKLLGDAVFSAEKVFEEYRATSRQHFEVLSLLTSSIGGLQSWLMGEVSWFDSLVFYVSAAIICALFTSSQRTASARFPILLLLSCNIALERLICLKFISNAPDADIVTSQQSLYYYIWLCRYCFMLVSIFVLILQIYMFKDYNVINNDLLLKIHDQSQLIKDSLDSIKRSNRIVSESAECLMFTRERSVSSRSSVFKESKANNLDNRNVSSVPKFNYCNNLSTNSDNNFSNDRNNRSRSVSKDFENIVNNLDYTINHQETPKDINVSYRSGGVLSGKKKLLPLFEEQNGFGRYNLRSSSRAGTPDVL